ncbi:MAG: hypothetical protein RIE74_11045 [Pseudomonadales bacterium]
MSEDLKTLDEDQLLEHFVERSRAGESLQPIFSEQTRRREKERAFYIARACNAIAHLAKLQLVVMVDEDCGTPDRRMANNASRGAIATAIELLADGVIADAEHLEGYIAGEVHHEQA